MLHRIRRIGILQTSTFVAALYALIGLLLAPIVYLLGRLPAIEGAATMGSYSLLVALGAPVMYAVFGFVSTAIACVIYNLLARVTGGMEIELVVVERA